MLFYGCCNLEQNGPTVICCNRLTGLLICLADVSTFGVLQRDGTPLETDDLFVLFGGSTLSVQRALSARRGTGSLAVKWLRPGTCVSAYKVLRQAFI